MIRQERWGGGVLGWINLAHANRLL